MSIFNFPQYIKDICNDLTSAQRQDLIDNHSANIAQGVLDELIACQG